MAKPKRPVSPLLKATPARLDALRRDWRALPPEWRASARARVLRGEGKYLLEILEKEGR